MIDVNIGWRSPACTVVGALPRAGRWVTVGADCDTSTITLQHGFTRAAATRLNPVRKQVAVVRSIINLGSHRQSG